MDYKRKITDIILLLSQHRFWTVIATVCCLLCAFISYFKGDVINGIFWMVALLVNITLLKNGRR